jgi:hypothetical protein
MEGELIMKVFISWSGELSRQLGEAMKAWLPGVLQSVRPYFTPYDIEKGSRWADDISKNLEECRIGLLCMTREALNSSWMMFEAGALSKHLGKSYVCPILFNVDNSDLKGPLTQFQTTQFNKEEIKKLLITINSQTDSKLEAPVLNDVYEMWWPKLEAQIHIIMNSYLPEDPQNNKRSDRELIEEILELTRRVNMKNRGGISNKAIIDLVEARNLIATQCVNSIDFALASHIEALDKPLEYLLNKLIASDSEITKLRDSLIKVTLDFNFEDFELILDDELLG